MVRVRGSCDERRAGVTRGKQDQLFIYGQCTHRELCIRCRRVRHHDQWSWSSSDNIQGVGCGAVTGWMAGIWGCMGVEMCALSSRHSSSSPCRHLQVHEKLTCGSCVGRIRQSSTYGKHARDSRARVPSASLQSPGKSQMTNEYNMHTASTARNTIVLMNLFLSTLT